MASRGKTAAAKLEEEGQAFGRRRLRDVLFIGVGAACLFVLMALLTYSDSDPGWSASGTGWRCQPISAASLALSSADIFFSLIGSAAYLVPVLLAYRAVSLLLADDDRQPVDWQLLGFRSLGLLLLIVAATALRALNDAGDSGLPQGCRRYSRCGHWSGFRSGVQSGWRAPGVGHAFPARVSRFLPISAGSGSLIGLGRQVIEGARFTYREGLAWLDRMRDRRAREKQLEERKVQIEQHVAKEKKRAPPKIKPPKETPAPSIKVEREKTEAAI